MSIKENVKQTLTQLLHRLAEWLNVKLNKYPARHKKVALIVFGLLVSTFCLFLIFGIVGTTASRRALRVDSISVPTDIYPVSIDTLKTWTSKAMDSLKSVIRQLYKDQSY